MATIKIHPHGPAVGEPLTLEAVPDAPGEYSYRWTLTDAGGNVFSPRERGARLGLATGGFPAGEHLVRVAVLDAGEAAVEAGETTLTLAPPASPLPASAAVPRADVAVTLQRTSSISTDDVALWVTIRHSARALSFNNYARAMERLLCGLDPEGDTDAPAPESQRLMEVGTRLLRTRFLPFNDTDAYRYLKVATEAFVLANVQALSDLSFTARDLDEVRTRLGLRVSGSELSELWERYLVPLRARGGRVIRTLPYLAVIRRKLGGEEIRNSVFAGMSEPAEACHGILADRLSSPLLISLIWSYWQEEGMLVQSMNHLSRRFQNIRGPADHDPLAHLEIDPLRPLNNLLWGYVQDEPHRLAVRRRAYEYDHHYGFSLQGRAIGTLRTADSRSKFLEAFHSLLHLTTLFYAQDDDTTVVADAFPLLNALRDVHLVLSQGAHNQFGDLPSTARQEMLLQQWLLARQEFGSFLPSRVMVAYPEPWMDRVDAMKSLQGWTDTSVLHFHTLAVQGEQLLLSVRYGHWSDPDLTSQQAANWARFWRQEVQGYIYAYRTVTGVDLNAAPSDPAAAHRDLPPSVHLQRQLDRQRQGVLPPARVPSVVQVTRPRGRLPR